MASRYGVDLLDRRKDSFLLWAPGRDFGSNPPLLVLGKYNSTADGLFDELVRQPLATSSAEPGLWVLGPDTISPVLKDGVYHYWFEILDDSPEKWGKMLTTDPISFTVDYRVTRQTGDQKQPASVIKYRDGKLWACSLDGKEASRPAIPKVASLPANNHLVIYELPTSWAKGGADDRGADVDVGTFADVSALFDSGIQGRRFASISSVRDEVILKDLGINALELLPAADAKTEDEWGYATAHYFAPDYDLGSSSDLVSLVETIHSQNIRLVTDVVMAFGHDPYGYIDFKPFHLRPRDEPDNPDSYQSHASGVLRDGYGGQSWRYIPTASTYDPESGKTADVHPSWAFHRSHLARWMADFGVGGLRLDSVNNIGSWDFVRSYKERAWELYNARYGSAADPSKFLVIGEELSMPVDMVQTGCLNALWNEPWQGRLRAVLLGQQTDATFSDSIRRLVDCTLDDNLSPRFTDGSQAINYVTNHDIEGFRKERLYNFLQSNGIWDVERRAKLAFVLLLTSVGIPMIFAGEEFADQMDRSVDMGKKQTDPVNYARKNDGGWRQALFDYVANLVQFRTKCPALGVDDTEFFHVDESRGGKIMAWNRGGDRQAPVVVVANFTDTDTPGSEYVVPNWPRKEVPGWREITQGRDVPAEWVGREPLMAWEAKVYTYWQ
ncbi:putative alpha amylase catalytic region protein [Phaeoacremonium minimum UCRPA7]|uniref:Putative alpha amylase catalytic region protein n=1 Tax=Phaeoacremonium minimum (strain UCR-PA7) TaxID=1286976 RepID=R8BY17_PHAM7|nr:putative alpha amylase catalytic region protein [Phaeoacremonium minimum UCRPA7]EOO04232.1 putative alpha amylase catalytic region protein [Phaeoacremonium minimum UCRPA7]